MVNSQLSTLRESNQDVAGPMRHGKDMEAWPLRSGLSQLRREHRRNMPIGEEEQDVKVQAASASWATEAQTGCREGASLGGELSRV